jgi:lysyl-tRNA synthetase class II
MSQAPILPSHDAHSEYEVRKAKVQQLREMGIVPYAQGYDKKHMISNLIQGNQKNLTE